MNAMGRRYEQDLTVLHGAYIMKGYIKATKRIYKRHIGVL